MTKKKATFQPADVQHTVEIISGLSAWKFLGKLLLQHFAHCLTQKNDDK